MTITRHPDETDDQLRARAKAALEYGHRNALRVFLRKLGLKSARGLYVDFRTMYIRKPGAL